MNTPRFLLVAVAGALALVAPARAAGVAGSWFVPSRVEIHVDLDLLTVASVEIAGEANGGASAALDGSFRFLVEGSEFTLPFVSESKGVRTYAAEGIGGGTATVRNPRSGSSRYPVTIRLNGGFSVLAEYITGIQDGLDFSLAGALAGACNALTVQSQDGSDLQTLFDSAAGVGTLQNPGWWLQTASVASKGDGKDSFKLLFSVPTLGPAPETAPDLSLALFGFSGPIPGSAAVRNGDRWTWTSKADQALTAVADYALGTVAVKGKKASLGAIPAGPAAAAFTLTLGTDVRSGEVRLGRKGKRLVW